MKKYLFIAILLLLQKTTVAAVSFTFITPVCGTLNDSFTNTSTGVNIAYLWNFGDPASGASNFSFNATKIKEAHTFSNYGTYNVKLYILDINSNPVDSVMHTIQLIAAPLLFIIPIAQTTFCNGDSVNNFVTASLDPAYKYSWNPTPLTINSTGNSVQYQFNHSQTYTVTAIDTTTGCSNSKSLTVTFVNCAKITSQFTFTAPLCGVFNANFKNTSLEAHHYKWYFGDPASGINDSIKKSDSTMVSHTFSDTGSFYVSLVVFDSLESKKDSSVKLVKIYKQSSAIIVNNDTTVCIRSKVTLSGIGIGTASWSPSNSLSTTTGYSTIAAPLSTTTYYLTTNNNGCIATDSVTIYVQTRPDPDFNADTLCLNSPFNFVAANTGYSYYHWDFGTGDTLSGANVNYSFDTAGTFNVKLYIVNGACDSFVIKPVVVLKDPVADFSPDKYKEEISKATFQFYNKSNNATHYSWDFGDLNSSMAVSPVHTFSDTGWYRVILTAINNLGCRDTFSLLLRVDNVYKYFVPNAFSPNGTGPIENDRFKVFGPQGLTKFEMTIYNRWGERVFYSTDENITWDGTSPDGKECVSDNYVYTIKFKDPTGKRLIINGVVNLIR